ncbi:hypothetical protein BCR43DRAFT_516669 [Syncephalastrum racemosum]|uniref:Uncharacterized protein n=1 Tax=Syncephalastrum racemosum TaxID=13706 RepID=A0A1X2H928_SYNRA|nr:hypothetical protein BCR43DRAFT_516669 [Syncephalastrum racemosum]
MIRLKLRASTTTPSTSISHTPFADFTPSSAAAVKDKFLEDVRGKFNLYKEKCRETGRKEAPFIDTDIYDVRTLSHITLVKPGEQVKADRSTSTACREDLYRLVIFAKDSLDVLDEKSIMIVHVVGYHVTFYLLTLEATGFYVMFEVNSIHLPKTFQELSHFLVDSDRIKNVMRIYDAHCVALKEKDVKRQMKRRTLEEYDLKRILNIRSPRKKQNAVLFK